MHVDRICLAYQDYVLTWMLPPWNVKFGILKTTKKKKKPRDYESLWLSLKGGEYIGCFVKNIDLEKQN